MALHGTLDTFALPDVMRLLASTRKTGRLQVVTDRGMGAVWVDGGAVVDVSTEAASSAASSAGTAEVLFELLRATGGEFEFDPRPLAPHTGPAEEVEPLLARAEAQLAEWREIEAVVPSLDAWLTLRPSLPSPSMTIDAGQWAVLVAIGSGTTVRQLGAALDLGEIAVSRRVKELVESGIATVEVAVAGNEAIEAGITSWEVAGHEAIEAEDGTTFATEELASQIAMLSPRAAQAVTTASLDPAS